MRFSNAASISSVNLLLESVAKSGALRIGSYIKGIQKKNAVWYFIDALLLVDS
jgi:hypothetical protein